MLVLQDVGPNAAAANSLGLTSEDLQRSGPASKLTLKLQDTMELDEYPERVCSLRSVVLYRLVVVVFRTGGFANGHFYAAVQASPDRWVVYNSEQVSGPYSLDGLQAVHGEDIYGTAYLRNDMPVAGDRQSLGQWLQQPLNSEAAQVNLQLSHIRQKWSPLSLWCCGH